MLAVLSEGLRQRKLRSKDSNRFAAISAAFVEKRIQEIDKRLKLNRDDERVLHLEP